MRKVIVMGAGGRDFHNFNVVFRNDPGTQVVAFTATQIPGIANRFYPASLAGPLYPEGIPIRPEDELTDLVRALGADEVILAYSDLKHETVMHKASLALTGQVTSRDGPGQLVVERLEPALGLSPSGRLVMGAAVPMDSRAAVTIAPRSRARTSESSEPRVAVVFML